VQIIPAIDLKDNKCVRLTAGRDKTSIVFNDDPEKQAIYFQEIGCKKIHIVDLDAAFGRSDVNLPSIKKIIRSVSIPIQLGGGIRSKINIEKYFDLGIQDLIIGSMSINNPNEIKKISTLYKERIYVSLDIKDGRIMIKGWEESSNLDIEEVLSIYKNSNIKGYVITDIKNDGMLKGLDIGFINKISKKIQSINNLEKKIIIAGGLTNYDDLRRFKDLNLKGVEGIISGKSYYVGNIDLNKAQKILEQNG
tara:strand:+ start:455 stop:1204 length:750 start_codon:yes stop_codon:yes gene_type:complete